MVMFTAPTMLQLCQQTLDYKAQIIRKQHFEIEKLNRVNDFLLRDRVSKESFTIDKTDNISRVISELTSELDGL